MIDVNAKSRAPTLSVALNFNYCLNITISYLPDIVFLSCKIVVVYFDQLSSAARTQNPNRNTQQVFFIFNTGPTMENLVLDPLAVLSLDNRLHMSPYESCFIHAKQPNLDNISVYSFTGPHHPEVPDVFSSRRW